MVGRWESSNPQWWAEAVHGWWAEAIRQQSPGLNAVHKHGHLLKNTGCYRRTLETNRWRCSWTCRVNNLSLCEDCGVRACRAGWEGCCIEACSHRATGTCVRTRPAIGRGGGGNQHREGSGHGRVHAQLAQMARHHPPPEVQLVGGPQGECLLACSCTAQPIN